MVRLWPPVDPTADDHRRPPTHRMVCFQQYDQAPATNDGLVASWCALYPLGAGSFAEPDVFVRLIADKSTLLDVDTGAAVSATRRPDRRWEVRPLTGQEVMVTSSRVFDGGPGFAEAKGLAPLIIPRPGRAISPYAKAVAGRRWVPSPSLETVGGWRRRRRRAMGAEVAATTAMAGLAVGAAVVGHPMAVFLGGLAAYNGIGLVWRRRRDRVVTANQMSEDGDGSPENLELPLRTLVHLNWRPSPDLGAMAWVLISDDKHGTLEAPVTGLAADLIDGFPTMAAIEGPFESGTPVRLILDDGTALQTVRPLRRAR